VTNPKRAKTRQQYVLRRMHELRFVDDAAYEDAQKAPLLVRQGLRETLPTHAEFAAEMARQVVFEAYGEEAYTRGLTVRTTLRRADQEAAHAAVRRGLLDYDRRHGYRGPETYVNLPGEPAEAEAAIDRVFQEHADVDNLVAAVVLEASPTEVKAVLASGDTATVSGDGLRFAARSLQDKSPPNVRIRRGAVVRLAKDDKGRWGIAQLPLAEAAFIALDPRDGALRALVGGFDFERNKFNHATQAQRQPGSAFKPFIYSAALEKGFSPATVINDAPFFVPAERAGGEEWEPKNYDGRFEGPMRLRTALAKSKNLVTVRVLQAIGPQYAQDYIAKFGFDPKAHPAVLSMGLGSGAATPMQMAAAFSVFANGGYRVSPYLIARITDARGTVLSEAQPLKAGGEAERVIDARNAFVMTSMLRDVVAYGTATKALSLGRRDIAGKTGTTNENVDAWFAGYTPQLVGVAWVGHDQPKPLGANETGAVAALPIWIAFMQKALKGLPDVPAEPPEGLVSLRINAESGLRDDAGTISEWFFNEYVPRREEALTPAPVPGGRSSQDVRNQLF
jgi:penicillin-binding protein 1A